jgi:hypothetical protein
VLQVAQDGMATGGVSANSDSKGGDGPSRRMESVSPYLAGYPSSKLFKLTRPSAVHRHPGYALFFATFDSSRRLALHVREIIDSSQPRLPASSRPQAERPMAFFGLDEDDDDDDDSTEEGGLGRTGTKWGRLGQAGVLVAGGITAGTLFQLSSRPFDAILQLLQSPAHLRSPKGSHGSRDYLLSHLRKGSSSSTSTSRTTFTTGVGSKEPLPALPLIIRTYRRKGRRFFFGPQAGEGKVAGTVWKRVAWRFIGVAPWGLGFLTFACAYPALAC